MPNFLTNKLLIIPATLFLFLLVPATVHGAPDTKTKGNAKVGIDCNKEVGNSECAGQNQGQGQGQASGYQCGNLSNEKDNIPTTLNFGCLGKRGPPGLGPIQDMLFALIRFASVGVGIAITASIIYAGIQYSSAEGNPEATQKAKLRIQNTVIGLMVYIFAFSVLQYMIPGGLFKPGSWLFLQPFMIKLGIIL